jgi:hypothetical protein
MKEFFSTRIWFYRNAALNERNSLRLVVIVPRRSKNLNISSADKEIAFKMLL